MKTLPLSLLLALISTFGFAQTRTERDSLFTLLKTLPQDTNRVKVLQSLAFQYHLTKPDTTCLLGQQAYDLARSLRYPLGEARALNVMALGFNQLGDYAKSLKLYGQAKEISLKLNDQARVAVTLNNIADTYMVQGQWQKALTLMQECYAIYQKLPKPLARSKPVYLINIGECYLNLNQLDSAAAYFKQAAPLALAHNKGVYNTTLYDMGDVAFAQHNIPQAKAFYYQSIAASLPDDNYVILYEAYYRLAKLYEQTGQRDSTIVAAQRALQYGQKAPYISGILKSSQLLTALYKGKNDSQALAYYEIAMAAKDTLFSQAKVKQLLSLDFEEKQRAAEIAAAETAYQTKIRYYVLFGVVGGIALLALILLRNNRQKQKANTLLQRQRDEINDQRQQLQASLETLKSTQAQLIQSEKLASLGELTAGIAHEIQNPLNFVNNFSEMSVELAQELKDEVKKPEKDWELIEDLAEDLSKNQSKINHHGKRASSIVSGMLEHSKASTGERALTDINKLADEYLRLSYHGIRAKDSNFNSDYQTNFDANLPKIEVIPQDIGRVLLNLINNAFWAVGQRAKGLEHGGHYVPKVMVSTKMVNNQVVIIVADNGIGMTDEIKAKIFQPFFTTKPTGQGTGLGLSLAYDIVTKGHGGTIEVESVEGEGSTFVVKLPM